MKSYLWLILILFLATALRLYGLGAESLWLDESFTWTRMSLSPVAFLRDCINDTQDPFYYVICRIWWFVAPHTDSMLRLPSAVFGIFSVAAVYLLAWELFASTRIAALSALLLAVNPFALYYSQDARPYELFLLLTIASLWAAVRAARNVNRVNAMLFVTLTAADLYTHPYAPFLLPLYILPYFLFRERREPAAARIHARQYALLLGLILLLFLPELANNLLQLKKKASGGGAAGWLSPPSLYALRATWIQYFMWPALAVPIAVAGTGAGLAGMISRPTRRAMLLLLAIIAAVVIVPWLFSNTVTPIYAHRYTIPALAAVIMLVAWTLAQIPWKGVRVGLVILLLAAHVVPLHAYFTKIDKDTYRQSIGILNTKLRSGDVVVLSTFYCREVLQRYFNPPANVTLVVGRRPEDLPPSLASASRVWLVEGYDMKRQAYLKTIRERINPRLIPLPPISAGTTAQLNPYRYWFVDVLLTLYAPPDSAATD